MRIRKGRLRLSPNEEAAILKEETEKRRKLRLQQVREQSKENAAKIRNAVKQEKHKQLMRLATDIKNQLDAEKAERVRHLEQQYDNSLRNIGVGHKQAADQPDWSEERELVQKAANLRAEARGRTAIEKHKLETAQENHEANKHIMARKQALEVERARAAEVASMPPPPPDPALMLNQAKPKPVKVTDMNTFSTTHYHLQNEHAVDRAWPLEQTNARDAAEIEAERIKERALELKRLREDQLERARLRHNAALEKELLKHDYNNILHDLSDLQRADRERRLKIVHSIPKQVFEPPNVRMEDREEKQRNLEEEFENMYMAGTNHLGDISMALDPQPRPMTPTQETSLDVTANDGTPLQEPTLPLVPPVLRDMTNMPKPKSPGKKPEKVLRNLMDRIKSQREDWMTSQSMADVGDSTQHNGQYQSMQQGVNGQQFYQMVPDDSPVMTQQDSRPSPEKLARIHSPDQVAPPTGHQMTVDPRNAPMAPNEFAEKLRAVNHRQQTNVQIQAEPAQTTFIPNELQQMELAEVLKQQEIIAEQKRQLELKLQQLTFEQQKMELAAKATALEQQLPAPGSNLPGQPAMQQPQSVPQQLPASVPASVQQNGYPQQNGYSQVSMMMNGQGQMPYAQQPPPQGPQIVASQPAQPVPSLQQQFASSLSSSGMSQRPMNSIPPTHTTGSAPLTAFSGYPGYQGQVYQGQGQPLRSAYQPASAALTTDQLAGPAQQSAYTQPAPQYSAQNGYPASYAGPATSVGQGQCYAVSPGHIPPASLTTEGMSEQMRKVKEYQQHLLNRHEQSKKVLDETKAEIKRRRENLLERYPNLDLSRLEELGAKHLGPQGQQPQMSQDMSSASRGQGQGHPVPVSSLLASLAAHPYYVANLSRSDAQQVSASSHSIPTATVSTAQISNMPTHPDIDLDANLRKNNKLENIRKSLPFDADETLPTPVRVYEAYAQKSLDTTDMTESDTSTLTERGSPALKPAPRPAPRTSQHASAGQRVIPTTADQDTTNTESELETTASASMLSERDDASELRQDQLRQQLLEIQRQKDEIIKRHQQGQQKLQDKEEELKAKLATLKPEELQHNLRQTMKQNNTEQASQPAIEMNFQNGRQLQLNLSTIQEVDTPASTRPSDSGTSDGETISQRSKKSLDFSQPRTETIPEVPEQPGFENVETQMQKSKEKKHPVGADYSGRNIDDVLERAKRFEAEVLQKLRKQTNAVLFDNEFDDSLEFNVSRRQASLSSGSLTPSSLSTGPLDDTAQSRLTDPRSANGSFQQTNSKSWADELSQYKIPASNQSELSFKVVNAAGQPVQNQTKINSKPLSEKPKSQPEGSVFAGDKSRFKVYSDINESDVSKSDTSSLENSKLDSTADSFEPDSMNAGAMLEHLKHLQEQLRKGEEERIMLAKKLAEQQTSNTTEPSKNSLSQSKDSLSQYSLNSSGNVSRPLTHEADTNAELSQYSFADNSTDVSMANNKSANQKQSHDPAIQSGASFQQKALPVRRSPIGDNAKTESRMINGSAGSQDLTEYSFTLSDSREQRSTSTPGDERRKSAMNGTQGATELPSAITLGRPSDTGSSKFGYSGTIDLSSYTLPESVSGSTTGGFSENTGTSTEFRSMTPGMDSTNERSNARSGMTAEESLESIKKEFEKLGKPVAKVKTFAVNRDGDLIPDQSDSDASKSGKNNDTTGGGADLTQYTFSSQSSAQDSKLLGQSGLSSYSLPESSMNKSQPQVSEFSNRNSFSSVSTDTNPKSSSFTNVTSEQSLNFTSNTNLTQYTLNSTNEDEAEAGQNENDNNRVNDKFASLDNLISESKTIIARHKEIINKNKAVDEYVPKPTTTMTSKSFAEESSDYQNKTNDSSMKETTASLSYNSKDTSGNRSSKGHESSLDHLIENSTGITDEQPPDFASMTMGSELSISESFNKAGDISDDADSLKSFEKHEESESNEDSLCDTSKSDSLQQIIEARKHNFMVQSEQRAVAAKERALAQCPSTRETHQTFRAVPVSIVAEPTLSMSVNTTNSERGKSPTTVQTKGTRTFNEPKETFQSNESKEKERKTSVSSSATSKALNRALQPRGSDHSPKPKDSGTRPPDSGTKPKESGYLSKFASAKFNNDNKDNRGKLVGEIRSFGGSSGFSTPSPKKTPPKVAPKPVRSKSVEPPASKPATSGLSKTLSSWKKSRTISVPSKLPEPVPRPDSVKVLPKEAPPTLTEEERRQRAEDELYEKNIRLQFKLDRDDTQDSLSPQQSEKSSRDSKKFSMSLSSSMPSISEESDMSWTY